MATFELEGPDGIVYEVEAPDPQSAAAAFKKMTAGQQPAAPGQKTRSWSDVPMEAIGNLPQSAANFAAAVAQPFLHPIETAQNLGHLAAGVGSKIVGATDQASEAVGGPDLQSPERKAYAEGPLNAVGQFLGDRYGSVDALKNTLATDPVGAAADASIVLTGGGAALARGPGVVGKAGQAVRASGDAINPVNAAVSGLKATGNAAAQALGVTSGTGATPIKAAFEAGRLQRPSFADHMRGNAPMEDVVNMAQAGVDDLVQRRSNAYKAWMPTSMAQAPQKLNMAPLDKAVQDGLAMGMRSGVVKDRKTASAMQEIADTVNTYKQNGWTTAKDLDELKQIVYDIGGDAQQGSRAHKAVMSVYHAIGNELKAQVPLYADVMKNYGRASETIRDMRRTLSLNNKASTDTQMRKLQSVMRNNVNTNYGARAKLVDELAQSQPDLPYALAGQAMNDLAPRGLARISAGGAGLTAMAANPAALAFAPLTSPRLVGEAAYAAGRGVRGLERAGRFAGRASPVPVEPQALARALLVAQLTGRQADEESPP